jgi:hypothetical protein
MTGKWLVAFRETEEAPLSISQPRAVSANSANSPLPTSETGPNGTIGAIGTPEQVSAVSGVSPVSGDDLEERAAIIEYEAGVPRAWAEGYAALSMMSPPLAFTPERWRRIVDAAGVFIDRWASKAADSGWSATDVFGCHPVAPDKRFDAMGICMLLDRCDVVGVDADGADLIARTGDACTRYYRRPVPLETISFGELAVAAGEPIPADYQDDIDA